MPKKSYIKQRIKNDFENSREKLTKLLNNRETKRKREIKNF